MCVLHVEGSIYLCSRVSRGTAAARSINDLSSRNTIGVGAFENISEMSIGSGELKLKIDKAKRWGAHEMSTENLVPRLSVSRVAVRRVRRSADGRVRVIISLKRLCTCHVGIVFCRGGRIKLATSKCRVLSIKVLLVRIAVETKECVFEIYSI